MACIVRRAGLSRLTFLLQPLGDLGFGGIQLRLQESRHEDGVASMAIDIGRELKLLD